MNNILFLDDCPDRIAKFRTLVPTAKTAETANDMINLISNKFAPFESDAFDVLVISVAFIGIKSNGWLDATVSIMLKNWQ